LEYLIADVLLTFGYKEQICAHNSVLIEPLSPCSGTLAGRLGLTDTISSSEDRNPSSADLGRCLLAVLSDVLQAVPLAYESKSWKEYAHIVPTPNRLAIRSVYFQNRPVGHTQP